MSDLIKHNNFSFPSVFLRRTTTGLSELLSLTQFRRTASWVEMNRYAARCPNWRRDSVNAIPPPAQVSQLWVLFSFYFLFYVHHFLPFLHLCMYLQRQLLQLQCRLLSTKEEGESKSILSIFTTLSHHHHFYLDHFTAAGFEPPCLYVAEKLQ